MLTLVGIDLGDLISGSDFVDVISSFSDMFFGMFNTILKFFFQDIKVFHIGIGYILLAIGIIGALASTLIDNPKND